MERILTPADKLHLIGIRSSVLLRLRHGRGHWFDPSTAHETFAQLNPLFPCLDDASIAAECEAGPRQDRGRLRFPLRRSTW